MMMGSGGHKAGGGAETVFNHQGKDGLKKMQKPSSTMQAMPAKAFPGIGHQKSIGNII